MKYCLWVVSVTGFLETLASSFTINPLKTGTGAISNREVFAGDYNRAFGICELFCFFLQLRHFSDFK